MELKKMKIRIVSPKRKNPRLAALASLFFAGLGQVYNGDIVEGSAFVCIQVINICLSTKARRPRPLGRGSSITIVIGFATYPLVWAYSILDAYKGAEKYNERIAPAQSA